MSDRIVALIRTVVPGIVGSACTWGAKHLGLELNSVGLTAIAVTGATSVYYALVSALERRWPAFGVLLGVPKAPSYPSSAAPFETGDEKPAPLGLEQIQELLPLLPPGTTLSVPPAADPEPRTFTVTVDANGAHLEEQKIIDALSEVKP